METSRGKLPNPPDPIYRLRSSRRLCSPIAPCAPLALVLHIQTPGIGPDEHDVLCLRIRAGRPTTERAAHAGPLNVVSEVPQHRAACPCHSRKRSRLQIASIYTQRVIVTESISSLRARLYESYVSQHSGRGPADATRTTIYRHNIRHLLPPPSAGPIAGTDSP